MTAQKKWLIRFFALLLALCVLCAATVAAVDPFCYYRLTDRPYFANIFFFSPGMIRHADYETVLLGSSMALHFDPDLIDEALHTKTLKICENGMNVTELKNLLAACRSAGRAKRYLICLDMDYYRFTEPPASKYPVYLLNQTKLDDFKYWFNFDVWTKYLPLDAASLVTKAEGSAAQHYRRIGLLKSTEGYNEETALHLIRLNRPNGSLSRQARAELEAMIPNFDEMLREHLAKFDRNTQLVLFLPPMSAGRWYLYSLNDTTHYFYEMREHIAEAVAAYDNITLYDFQSCDFTNDLSLYRDAIHYNYTINDYMTREFAKPDHVATPETVKAANRQIAENMERFAAQYGERLK